MKLTSSLCSDYASPHYGAFAPSAQRTLGVQLISRPIMRTISLVVAIIIYFIRVTLNDVIPTPGNLSYLLIPIACLSLIASIIYLVFTIWFALHHGGHASPMIVLVTGVILAVVFPIPPPYEEGLFNRHREEFEHIVELARNSQLEHSSECSIWRSFVVPNGFEKLSADCIFVDYEPFLTVEFQPRNYMDKLVFIEDPSEIEDTIGCGPGDYRETLDENWFVCHMSP
jgi:hypothetical protein